MNLTYKPNLLLLSLLFFFLASSGEGERVLNQRRESESLRIDDENKSEFADILSEASRGAVITLTQGTEVELDSLVDLTAARLTIRGEGKNKEKPTIKCTSEEAKIIIRGNKSVLSNFIIKNCTSPAIRIASASQEEERIEVEILQVDFVENESAPSTFERAASGSLVIEPYTTTTIVDCKFEENVAEYGAGLFIAEPAVVFISQSIFRRNRGGGIWTDPPVLQDDRAPISSRLVINQTSFIENVVEEPSAGGFRDDISTPNGNRLESTIFVNFHDPGRDAGAFYIGSVDSVEIHLCEFVENHGPYVGAVMLADNVLARITDSTFLRNSPLFKDDDKSSGGAIYFQQTEPEGRRVEIENSEFLSNEANYGGAIHALGTAATSMLLRNVTLTRNQAFGYGGAILIVTEGLSIRENRAQSGGGVAILNGGGLRLTSREPLRGVSEIERVTVIANNTATDGGGLFLAGSGLVDITQGRFIENVAGRDGGAVCIVHTLVGSSALFKSCYFANNRAERGGAYYESGAARLTIQGGVPVYTALDTVSRYLSRRDDILLEGFFGNKALAGGALYVSASNQFKNELTIREVLFEDNEAVSSRKELQLPRHSSMSGEFNSDYLDVLGDDPCFPGGGGAACFALHDISPRSYGDYDMRNLRFTSNSARVGGALLISTLSRWNIKTSETCGTVGINCLHIRASSFVNNSATSAGGAIFATYPEHLALAEEEDSGGKLYSLRELDRLKAFFSENKVHKEGYGADVASLGASLQLLSPEENLTNLESGGTAATLEVRLADCYNQTVVGNIMDSVMPLSVYSERGIASGNLQGRIANGLAKFEVKITAEVGTYMVEILGERPELKLAVHVSTRFCYVGEYNVQNILCNRCPETSYTFNTGIDCHQCPATANCPGGAALIPHEGYWHSTPFSPVIHDCLEPEACQYKGRQGRLREFYDKNSVGGNLTVSALSYEEDYPQCRSGYRGILCGSCASDYGHMGNGKCKSCSNKARTRLLVIFSAVWMLVLMAFTIRSALISIRDFIAVKTHALNSTNQPQNIASPASPNIGSARKSGSLDGSNALCVLATVNGQVICMPQTSDSDSDDSSIATPPTFRGMGGAVNVPPVNNQSILSSPPPQANHMPPTVSIDHILAAEKISETIKIFTNFLQLTSAGIVINVEWTAAVKQMLTLNDGIAGFSNGSSIAPLECIVSGSPEERSVRYSILRIFMPFILLTITIIFFAIHWFRLKARQNKPISYLRSRIIICALVASFFSYHKITEYLMRILNCMYLDHGKDISVERCQGCRHYTDYATATDYYWAEDTSLRCFEGKHAQLALLLGFPGLFLFSLGVPLAILGTLLFNKAVGRLHDIEVLNTFGFVYQNYKDRFMFWEVCIMCRKAAVGAIVVFAYSLGSNLQSVMILGTLLVALLSQIAAFPFNDYTLNVLETSSLLVSILTFYFAIVFNDSNTSGAAKQGFSIILIILTGALVVAFLAVLVYNMDSFVEAKLKQMGHSVPTGRLQRPFKLVKVITTRVYVSVHDSLNRKLKAIRSNRQKRQAARQQRRQTKTRSGPSNVQAQAVPSPSGTPTGPVGSVHTSITLSSSI